MLSEATREFIRRHAGDDVRQLALRGTKEPDVDLSAALQQIAGRQTARRKLPTWAASEDIIYPPHLNMEQCSSEQTARYKAEVAARLLAQEGDGAYKSYRSYRSYRSYESHKSYRSHESHSSFVDLTGGLGVDFSFLAPLFGQATYVEQQQHLCQLARHNMAALGIDCHIICGNSTDELARLPHSTLIFLDPARRDSHGARTYAISDCTPDVLALRDTLLQKADILMLKLSPMLDWRKAVADLGAPYVSEVHIVSVQNECKELLIILSKEATADSLHLVCTNDDQTLELISPISPIGPIGPISPISPIPLSGYLYEPNASIMKAGCFSELCQRYGVSPIAHNSHLFVSEKPVDNFPGRRFCIVAVSSMNKKELREKIAPLHQANITARNFPLTVTQLRARLKLSEGGSNYLFATTLANGDHVLISCQRI